MQLPEVERREPDVRIVRADLSALPLRRGWKLITDDVSVVYDPEGLPLVQSSYPSQKLWRDALDRYERRELIEQHSLQRHFQRCVTLSTKVPMAAVTRIDGADCAGRMYDLITDHLSDLCRNEAKV